MRTFAESGVTVDRLATLRSTAQAARRAGYAPYSERVILAAVETDAGCFGGVNVENVNYSLTKHAEEVAVLAALLGGAGPAGGWVRTLYVAGPYPCGSCRQFVSEFARPDTVVLVDRVGPDAAGSTTLADLPESGIEAWTLEELLPARFRPEEIGLASNR